MDRLFGTAKEKTRNLQQSANQWAQQKVLAVFDPNEVSVASESASGVVSQSDVHCYPETAPGRNDPHRIRFKSHPTPIPNVKNATHINISAVTHLGEVHSNSTYVKRDLGFQGQLGPYILLSYGDTLYTDEEYSDTFRGIVSNSIAFATHDPTVVVDPLLDENGFPCQFVKTNPSWGEDPSTHAVGITSVVETQPGEGLYPQDPIHTNQPLTKPLPGIIFTLLNHRPNGTDNILGAGLAKITLDTTTYPPTPIATRLSPYIWNGTTEPWYGDVCVLKNSHYIYAYGHAKDNPYVYLTRVPIAKATSLQEYEYYHGPEEGWTSTPLLTSSLTSKESIFWQINQGQIFFSNRFNAYLFIYCDNFWSSQLLLRTSLKPEGPWSDPPITISKIEPITANGNIYAPVPHPYLDEDGGGRSLVVTFTNWPNCIQAVRVVFG